MIAENEIRATSPPWGRSRIAVESRDQGLFPTLDDAVSTLYPVLPRQRRARIPAVADVVDGLGDRILTSAQTLNQHQLTRLGTAHPGRPRRLISTPSLSPPTPPPLASGASFCRSSTRPRRTPRGHPPRRSQPRPRDYKSGRPRRIARRRLG